MAFLWLTIALNQTDNKSDKIFKGKYISQHEANKKERPLNVIFKHTDIFCK